MINYLLPEPDSINWYYQNFIKLKIDKSKPTYLNNNGNFALIRLPEEKPQKP